MYSFQKSKAIIIISLFSIFAGTAVVIGWLFDIPGLQDIFPGYVSMKFNPGLCFILLGAALLATQLKDKKYNKIVFLALSSLIVLMGSLSVLQDIFHFNAGIDQFFIADKLSAVNGYPFPGRMAANTAVCFILFGLAFFGFSTKSRIMHITGQYFLHLVTAISSVALMGYMYGLSLFYNLHYVSSMAIHTAVLFFLLSIIASLLHPSLGITNLFTGTLVGNKMAGRLFILIAFMAVSFGSLRVQSQRYQLFTLEVGISILAVCFLFVSLLLIWHTANWLNRIDLKRYEAEKEVKAMNGELEERVEKRSVELFNLMEKYRKSEEKYRALIEHASDAIYILDFEGNFIDANESMCKMAGYTKDELLQLNIIALVDPEQLKTDPVKHGPSGLEKGVIRERQLVRKTGQKLDVEINVRMFDDDKVLIIARDITDKKRMETDLREAELKFRTLAEKSMVGVYISQRERFTYVNPRFAEIFGYGQHELINTAESAVKIIISEEDQEIVWKNVQARYKGEIEIVNYEVTGKRKDGSYNRVEFYGTGVMVDGEPSIIGSMLDITERRKAEEILKRSEANLKTIMDTTDTAYALLDKELKVMAFNQMAVKFVNSQYNHNPVKGDQLVDYFPKDRFPQFMSYAGEVLNGKNISYEINYPQADGSVCWYYVRLFPITNDKKEIFGLMLALSDITERKNTEESLKAAYKLVQGHIDSIKEMAWKQSHLMRSPVANLKGLAAMLNADPTDKEVLKFINIELERLDAVIIEMAEDASNHDL